MRIRAAPCPGIEGKHTVRRQPKEPRTCSQWDATGANHERSGAGLPGRDMCSGAAIVGLALIVLLLLAGCGTTTLGHRFNYQAVDALVPGKTTEAEAMAVLGQPTDRRVADDLTVRVMWSSVEADMFGAKGHRVLILFDATGVMVRVVDRADY